MIYLRPEEDFSPGQFQPGNWKSSPGLVKYVPETHINGLERFSAPMVLEYPCPG